MVEQDGTRHRFGEFLFRPWTRSGNGHFTDVPCQHRRGTGGSRHHRRSVRCNFEFCKVMVRMVQRPVGAPQTDGGHRIYPDRDCKSCPLRLPPVGCTYCSAGHLRWFGRGIRGPVRDSILTDSGSGRSERACIRI